MRPVESGSEIPATEVDFDDRQVRKAAATAGKLDKITLSFPHYVLRLLVIAQSNEP
jgi:hypothetical protein